MGIIEVAKEVSTIPAAVLSSPLTLLSSPKIFFSTIVMCWQMRDEIKMLKAWSSLTLTLIMTRSEEERANARCQLCDRVMGDLLEATEDVEDIPCRGICFGRQRCVDMCEGLKEVQESAQEFPCVAVGYCEPSEGDEYAVERGGDAGDAVPECSMKNFKCGPATHCQRVMKGMRLRCELKPGIKKWVHMRRNLLGSASAMATAMMTWPHCTEENGHEAQFCIAEPTGYSYVAHLITLFLIFVVGGYRSLRALSTPGADDDSQCLTFWLVIAVLSSLEGYAKVILSKTFPPYFHAKCLFVAWLLFNDGADKIYRRLMRDYRFMLKILRLSNTHHATQIQAFNNDGFLEAIDNDIPSKPFAKYYDPSSTISSSILSPAQIHYYTGWSHHLDDLGTLYKYVDENKNSLKEKFGKYDWWPLLEEALAGWISFQPRYLRINLLRADNLPDLDKYEVTDPYAVLTVQQPHTPKNDHTNGKKSTKDSHHEDITTYGKVRSNTKFNTLNPVWNESFEIRLQGGMINDSTGLYENHIVEHGTQLKLSFYDEDGHNISLFLRFANLCLSLILPFLLLAAYLDYPYFTTPQYLEAVLEQKNDTRYFDAYDIGYGIDAQITSVMRMNDGRIATVPLVSFLAAIIFLEVLQRWWQQFTLKDDLIGQISINLKDLMDQKEHLFTQQSLIFPDDTKTSTDDSKTEKDVKSKVKQEKKGEESNRGKVTFAARLLE